MARYQSIIDVLIDDGVFERVYFDHETELDIPYREIGFLKRNALQEQPGKGRVLHKKWADICAIRNGEVKVIIEEERKATQDKVNTDIDIISRCKYLWVDGSLFPYDPECSLYIILNNNINGLPERVLHDIGNLKNVIICNKESFPRVYTEHTIP